MSERRRPCWREWLPLAVLLTCPERVVEAQARFPWPLVQLGLVSQGSPLTSESGWALGARLPIGLTRHLRLAPTFEFAKTHVTSSIVPCFFVGTPPQCLHRPDQESTLYFGAVIDIQPFPNGKVRPFAETGGAFGRSLSPPNPGEKRSFLLPQWGLGVDVPTPVWRAVGRWVFENPRSLPRSSRQGHHDNTADRIQAGWPALSKRPRTLPHKGGTSMRGCCCAVSSALSGASSRVTQPLNCCATSPSSRPIAAVRATWVAEGLPS